MSSTPIEIDLLYFDGCPAYKTAWQSLIDVISVHHLETVVKPINIDTLEKAASFRFAGSPTIKVNGQDLEGYQGEGVMACRVYEENGNKGWPSKALLEKRLLEAVQ